MTHAYGTLAALLSSHQCGLLQVVESGGSIADADGVSAARLREKLGALLERLAALKPGKSSVGLQEQLARFHDAIASDPQVEREAAAEHRHKQLLHATRQLELISELDKERLVAQAVEAFDALASRTTEALAAYDGAADVAPLRAAVEAAVAAVRAKLGS